MFHESTVRDRANGTVETARKVFEASSLKLIAPENQARMQHICCSMSQLDNDYNERTFVPSRFEVTLGQRFGHM
jgi:hypothetical protein